MASFLVNDVIKDYIFDLHQASRAKLSKVQSEVDALYGAKFQELSRDYYGDKTSWPAAATIASLAPDSKGSGDDCTSSCGAFMLGHYSSYQLALTCTASDECERDEGT